MERPEGKTLLPTIPRMRIIMFLAEKTSKQFLLGITLPEDDFRLNHTKCGCICFSIQQRNNIGTCENQRWPKLSWISEKLRKMIRSCISSMKLPGRWFRAWEPGRIQACPERQLGPNYSPSHQHHDTPTVSRCTNNNPYHSGRYESAWKCTNHFSPCTFSGTSRRNCNRGSWSRTRTLWSSVPGLSCWLAGELRLSLLSRRFWRFYLELSYDC